MTKTGVRPARRPAAARAARPRGVEGAAGWGGGGGGGGAGWGGEPVGGVEPPLLGLAGNVPDVVGGGVGPPSAVTVDAPEEEDRGGGGGWAGAPPPPLAAGAASSVARLDSVVVILDSGSGWVMLLLPQSVAARAGAPQRCGSRSGRERGREGKKGGNPLPATTARRRRPRKTGTRASPARPPFSQTPAPGSAKVCLRVQGVRVQTCPGLGLRGGAQGPGRRASAARRKGEGMCEVAGWGARACTGDAMCRPGGGRRVAPGVGSSGGGWGSTGRDGTRE